MKLLITGPESSGKSTLGKELTEAIDGIIFPEFARWYLEKNGRDYKKEDLLFFAKEHFKIYKESFQKEVRKSLIFDTSLLNIKIWSDVKFGSCDPWINNKVKELNFDIVMLLKPNIPWIADPLRESKDTRYSLFQIYIKELERLSWNYHIIDEKQDFRTQQALSIINEKKKTEK